MVGPDVCVDCLQGEWTAEHVAELRHKYATQRAGLTALEIERLKAKYADDEWWTADGRRVYQGDPDEHHDIARLEAIADKLGSPWRSLPDDERTALLVETEEIVGRVRERRERREAERAAADERRRIARLPAAPSEGRQALALAWLELRAIDMAAGVDPDTCELLTTSRFDEILAAGPQPPSKPVDPVRRTRQ